MLLRNFPLLTLDAATLMRTNIIYAAMPWRKGNRLRLVSEMQADEATRRIFSEIKRALGVPTLQLFYPALAVYPAFLQLHWEAVREIATSRELTSAADRVRADAYTRAHNYFQIPDLSAHARLKPDGPGDLAAIADFYHCVEPLFLLLLCYQMQALEGSAGQTGASVTPQPPREPLPAPPGGVEEESAPAALKKKYEEIRRAMGVPFVNPEYCAFACWPEFLNAYWDALKQMMGSPVYDECRYGLRSTAWTLASKLPGPTELSLEQLTEAGMTTEDVGSIARILDLFVSNLSAQLLNIATAKIALEGGNLAVPESQTTSRRRRKRPAA
jgi:hypothetical protein